MSWQQDHFDDLDEQWSHALLDRDRKRLKRQAGKQAGSQPAAASQEDREAVIASLADENDLGSDFQPTYTRNLDPKHFERRWLHEALAGFYQDRILDDVLHIVKGGKEANVYCCTGTEHVDLPLLAAKIYRPRMLRHLKNDALYKEGRFVRDQSGKEVRGSRESRAMAKKTPFGQDLDFASWIVHEFQLHNKLYEAGLDVPRPIAQRGNTILMAYVGETYNPARTLSDTTIPQETAEPLFRRIMGNVERMLALNYVHGDLSAYNILYWEGEIAIIDFPQVVDVRVNPNSYDLLERDVRRVWEYFAPFGVGDDPGRTAADLFQRYLDADL